MSRFIASRMGYTYSFPFSRRLKSAIYAPILGGAMVLMFGRILVMAGILDVEQFAVLNKALIASGLVAMLSCFGLFLDLQRRLPVQLELRQYRAAATYLALSTLGGAGLAIGGFVIAVVAGAFVQVSFSVVAVGVLHGFCQQMFLIATTESRSNGEPIRYSWQNLLRSVAVVGATIPVAYYWNSGLAVMLVEAAIGGATAWFILTRAFAKLAIPARSAFRLAIVQLASTNWISMLSLVLLSLALTASSNVDRWLAAYLLSPRPFAEYTFAWITLIIAFSVQALVNASVFPAIAKRLTMHGQYSAFRLTLTASAMLFAGCAVLVAPAIFGARLAIAHFYPAYINSVNLIPALAVAAIFRLSDFWSSFLIVAGRERTALAINVGSLVGTLVVWYLAFRGSPVSPLHLSYLAAAIAILTYVLSLLQCWSITYRSNHSQLVK